MIRTAVLLLALCLAVPVSASAPVGKHAFASVDSQGTGGGYDWYSTTTDAAAIVSAAQAIQARDGSLDQMRGYFVSHGGCGGGQGIDACGMPVAVSSAKLLTVNGVTCVCFTMRVPEGASPMWSGGGVTSTIYIDDGGQ